MEDHSQLLYLLYLTAHDVLRQAVFRNAEHQNSARLRFHLEDFHIEALARQVAGDGESGRARTDDGNLAPRLGQQVLADETHVTVEVGYEAFQLAHSYALALLVEHAVAFALFLMWAYASAYGGQVALAVYDVHGIAEVSHRQLMYPVRYVVAYWASFLALRNLAVEAAFGLVDGFKHGIAPVYFLK